MLIKTVGKHFYQNIEQIVKKKFVLNVEKEKTYKIFVAAFED